MRGRWRLGLEALFVGIVCAVFVRAYLLQGFQVPTPSMTPTVLVGDHLLVNKFIFGGLDEPLSGPWLPQRPLRRGDLVVFKYPGAATRDYLKRCVGLPGDVVALLDGQLWVNGNAVEESFGGGVELVANFGPVVVPPGQLFVLGDNRSNSNDSRAWGTVPRRYVKGRPVFVYWAARGSKGPPTKAPSWWPLTRLVR